MSRTNRHDTAQFRKELTEAMYISPTRRAQEERNALRQVRDYLLETHDEKMTNFMLSTMEVGIVIMPHDISDEYEHGVYSH